MSEGGLDSVESVEFMADIPTVPSLSTVRKPDISCFWTRLLIEVDDTTQGRKR